MLPSMFTSFIISTHSSALLERGMSDSEWAASNGGNLHSLNLIKSDDAF